MVENRIKFQQIHSGNAWLKRNQHLANWIAACPIMIVFVLWIAGYLPPIPVSPMIEEPKNYTVTVADTIKAEDTATIEIIRAASTVDIIKDKYCSTMNNGTAILSEAYRNGTMPAVVIKDTDGLCIASYAKKVS